MSGSEAPRASAVTVRQEDVRRLCDFLYRRTGMQGLLSQTRGYSGTTLLGDGAVLLVVDLKEVLP